MNAALPPTTPVLVGVGQAADHLDSPAYEGLSAADLAGRAAAAALADAGADAAALAAAIDTLATVRQFEDSIAGAPAPLGKSDNFPRSVAARIGADPRHAILEVSGGQGPQHLVNEMAAAIASGEREVVLLAGAEAISTVRNLAAADEKPDFTENIGGQLENRGYGLRGLVSMHGFNHGLNDAPVQYALFENARRARIGRSRTDYLHDMGALFAPFTEVAAKNPFSAAPTVRSAAELATPDERNRPISDPYLRYVVARDQVNQGAAVLLTSVASAERLGIPPEKWVFLHGHADLREQDLLERHDLSSGPASVLAVEHALEVAGAELAEIAAFDLYSCFPVAVFTLVDGLGLAPDDARGFTLTGGLPFFGGAGNNYSMHAIAEAVDFSRRNPGRRSLVGANGGTLSKYSVGVYSSEARAWTPDQSTDLQAQVASWPTVATTQTPDGWATLETYSVKHGRDGSRTAVVVGRLENTGERFLALGVPGDEALLDLLAEDDAIGGRIFVRTVDEGSRVSVSRARMDALLPVRAPGFREAYEHVLVRRDGHLLEVTINRPDARNSLHPPAHTELSEIFDAYLADPELWVAIITGAGATSFCAGNDLLYTATGKPMYIPPTGFAGLTSRAGMTKPVIAAVNGFAMGGGLEIALACHLVVADETAQLALSEVKVGLFAGAGGVVRLPRQLPEKVATEMILTGRRLGAEEAYRRGLVNRIAPAGQALETARELAAEILEGSPTSVRLSLQAMQDAAGIADTVAAVRTPTQAVDELITSEDMQEGMTAFVTKRPPQWRNR
ncbi:acetyl-CoA acetyltransferase [Nocardioides marmoriginsengisoli]|uniref:enoyl-CoA hydratase n=1 Tax=Nocardioides marmoriginsengisoli TaxID=661483 RepID=A0A3N0CCA1_9ACTN|nr:acetyl-CoA acetyltransferase [Nocardioides marmoriginsengisoli]RNL61070.1 acetyl-CoA acetyltransferase [Nocardioides marmoriginsengisoli]